MALKTLQPDAETRFGLEDVFGGDAHAGKLAWVNGWRKLPHLSREVEAQFDYPQQFAEVMFARIEHALGRRRSGGTAAGPAAGRLFIGPEEGGAAPRVADLPIQYLRSSDRHVVAAHAAGFQDEALLLNDRREGRCLVSYRTSGGWVGVTKAVLTDVLGAGHDARLSGLPPVTREALLLLCPELAVDTTGP
jgi:hypothetical protein